MLLSIAVLLTGIWLIIDSQETPASAITLIFGLAVAILAIVELVPALRARTRP